MRSELRALALVVALAGCRSVVGLDDLSFDDPPAGGAGAGGDAAGAAGTTSAGGVAGSSAGAAGVASAGGSAGASGASACDVGPAPNACAKCERDSCCSLVAACLGDTKCVDCVSNPSLPACWDNAAARALFVCATKSCDVPCVTGGTACNPITNEGCSGGDACDFGEDGLFGCFPPDNVEPLCAACSQNGPYCLPGLACLDSQCMQYCCEDGDCGSGGKCDKPSIAIGQLGVCVMSSGAAKCDAPAKGPSMGACVPM